MQENPDEVFVPTAQKRAAAGIAQKLLKEAGVLEVPTSLKTVIHHLQKSQDIFLEKLTDVSTKVSGLLVLCKENDDEYAVIGYNDKHPWCRRRFTIAHEIGHLLMGHACNRQENETSINETEANCFAAELLMPVQTLKKDIKTIRDIPTLAKRYLVSSQAMGIKLIDAHLLK